MASTRAPNAGTGQPRARKMEEVAMSVAIVIPETGFAELPIRPVMRDDTVTNRNPKIMTKMEATTLAKSEVCAPGTGLKVRKAHIMTINSTEPPTVTDIGRSSSVRRLDWSLFPAPSCFRLACNADTIVGTVFNSVMSPAAATAPAPIGRTYVRHKSVGDICEIGTVPG